jgi:hypothetical protein
MLDEAGDIYYFCSLEEAQSYIEPPDVDDCVVFCPAGELFDVTVEGASFWSAGEVRLKPSGRSDTTRLSSYLRHYLSEIKKLDVDDEMTLSELVELTFSHQKPHV